MKIKKLTEHRRNQILKTSFLLCVFFSLNVNADTKALSQTALGPQSRACGPAVKPEKSNAVKAKLLKPIFVAIAKELSESPLQSLCDQMPNFACWPEGHFPQGQIDVFEGGKGKVLIRVPCTSAAYNQTSFFIAASLGTQANTEKKKSKTTKKNGAATNLAPSISIVMFPTHPDFQTVPQLQMFGLKPLESIIGYRDFEPAKRRITAYTKGLGDGTFGHFHQYELPNGTLLPRLLVSIAKSEEDRIDPYHYQRGTQPPFVKSWIRMKSLKSRVGCFADFQNLQCIVPKK